MAEEDPSESAKDVASEKIDEVLSYKPRSLVRTRQLGKELDFRDGLPVFEKIYSLYSELRECDLGKLNEDDINNIVGRINNLLKSYERIKNFSPSNLYPEWGNDPVLQKDRLIEEAKASYKQSYEFLRQVIPFIRPQTSQQELTKLVQTAKDTEKMVKREFDKARDTAEQVEKTLEQAKEAAGETAVASYAKFFEDQAKEHRTSSRCWFWGVVVLMIITIVVASVEIVNTKELIEWLGEADYSTSLHVIFSKFIIFGSLYFAIVWAVRMHRASHHNYVVNKHRANALHTFEAFIKTSEDDPQTKRAVLLQTTQAIFQHQQSGYISNEPDPSPSPSQILEVIKQANQGH